MIVVCEQCATRFRLADELLRPEGRKVRCSVCGHVFVLNPPAGGDGPGPDPGAAPAPVEEVIPEFLAVAREAEDLPSEAVREAELLAPPTADDAAERLAANGLPVFPSEPAGVSVETETAARAETANGPRRSYGLTLLLLCILIVVAGVGALRYWAPALLPEFLAFLKPPPPVIQAVDPGISELAFRDVRGFFVDAAGGDRCFVIRGSVANNYPMARRAILVRGSLLDAGGQKRLQRECFAGLDLDARQLQELRTEDVDELMQPKPAKGFSKVLAGGTLPLTIVFTNLPPDVVEFKVEAIRSLPAAP